jgi:hypothetical protein
MYQFLGGGIGGAIEAAMKIRLCLSLVLPVLAQIESEQSDRADQTSSQQSTTYRLAQHSISAAPRAATTICGGGLAFV